MGINNTYPLLMLYQHSYTTIDTKIIVVMSVLSTKIYLPDMGFCVWFHSKIGKKINEDSEWRFVNRLLF